MPSARPADVPTATRHPTRDGILFGLAAYGIWGVLPIYFKALHRVDALTIVAHRVVWSMLVLALLTALLGVGPAVRRALADRRTRGTLVLSALLIAANWLLYVYAINSGHILAGSLGYYLNPISNILMGRFLLKERLTRLQWAAVAVAAAGVAVLAAGALDTLWISLSLCLSFGTYGFVRKTAPVDALAGLTVETLLLLPLALAFLGHAALTGQAGWFGADASDSALLMFAGIASTVPLLCFTAAARRLAYSTVGILQFIAPTVQFLVAVRLYGEAFTSAHKIAFAAIWAAMILYIAAMLLARRGPRPSAD